MPTPTTTTTIATIIPSRSLENLLPCLDALRQYEPNTSRSLLYPLVVWDRSGGADVLALPNAINVTTPFNFARNVNAGIAAVLQRRNVDGFLLLNDDALLATTGGFSLLAQAAKDHPEYGIIAAVTNNVGNLNQMRREIYGKPYVVGDGLREDPRMVCFIAVYIPYTTINAVGLLDETIGRGGFEDDDYCLRVRNAGLKIGIHDGCFVDHFSLNSTFRSPGGPGYDPDAADNFKRKWGTDNWGNPA